MSEFQVHFTRYSRDTGRRLNSSAFFMTATDLPTVVKLAEVFMSGMRQGGCTDDLQILSIEMRGVHGIQCHDVGYGIWETGERSSNG